MGDAPVGQLLAGGRAAKRRKRRGLVAGAAAATALVVGGGAIAVQGISNGSGDRDSNEPLVTDSAVHELTAQVEVGVPKPLATFLNRQEEQVAIWNSEERTVAFVPDMGYSSSCPQGATATATATGTVELTLIDDQGAGICTTDARHVTITIKGLDTAPSELTAIIAGESSTVPVQRGTYDRPSSGDDRPISQGPDFGPSGPEGFLELRLGMSPGDALQTGRLQLGDTTGACTGLYLAMYGDAIDAAHGYFTAGAGLSLIYGQGEMTTPEGITGGSTWAEVRSAYPDLTPQGDYYVAEATGDAEYFFAVQDGRVASWGLTMRDNPCLVAN